MDRAGERPAGARRRLAWRVLAKRGGRHFLAELLRGRAEAQRAMAWRPHGQHAQARAESERGGVEGGQRRSALPPTPAHGALADLQQEPRAQAGRAVHLRAPAVRGGLPQVHRESPQPSLGDTRVREDTRLTLASWGLPGFLWPESVCARGAAAHPGCAAAAAHVGWPEDPGWRLQGGQRG